MSDVNTFSIDGIDDPAMLELLQGIASGLVNEPADIDTISREHIYTYIPHNIPDEIIAPVLSEINTSISNSITGNIFIGRDQNNIGTYDVIDSYQRMDANNSMWNPLQSKFRTSSSKIIIDEDKAEKEVNTDTVEIKDINVFDDFIEQHNSLMSEIDASIDFDMNKAVSIKCSDPQDPISIVVVGCGGTGSRLVALLAQQMSTRSNISLMLVDPDQTEYKNLSRQNFFDFEVGEFKAQALAERYNMLYGINIEYMIIPFDSFNRKLNNDTFIFDCTDNKKARKSIQTFVSTTSMPLNKNLYLISCGNEKDYGQVHFSSIRRQSPNKINFNEFSGSLLSNKTIDKFNFHQSNIASIVDSLTNLDISSDVYLPEFLSYNKTFKDNVESASCVNMDIAEEQSMAINSTIAQIAFNMFFQWLVSKDGLTNMIVHANLSNTFTGQKVNTVEGLLDIYVRDIFGKGVFFEKEVCQASLLNLCIDYKKIKSSTYREIYASGKINEKYKKSLIVNKYSNDKGGYSGPDLYSEYFETQLNSFIKYIDENYKSTKEDSHYLEIVFLLTCYLRYLSSFKQTIVYIGKDHYYNRQGFGRNINAHITSLITKLVERFESIGGSYKFFEEEN